MGDYCANCNEQGETYECHECGDERCDCCATRRDYEDQLCEKCSAKIDKDIQENV